MFVRSIRCSSFAIAKEAHFSELTKPKRVFFHFPRIFLQSPHVFGETPLVFDENGLVFRVNSLVIPQSPKK